MGDQQKTSDNDHADIDVTVTVESPIEVNVNVFVMAPPTKGSFDSSFLTALGLSDKIKEALAKKKKP